MKRYKIQRGFGRMKMVEAPNGEYVFFSEVEHRLGSVNAVENLNSQYSDNILRLRIELSDTKQQKRDLEYQLQKLKEHDGHFETQSKIMAKGLDKIAQIENGQIKGTIKGALNEIRENLKQAGL